MKSFTLCLSLMLSVFTASAVVYTPVAVTGYNQDLVADGSGPSAGSVSVSTGFDGVNYAFVAQNYSYSGTPSYYLPTSGTLNSKLTTGLSWQLASYTANNVLHLPNANDTGRLTFVTPQSAAEVEILCTSGSGSATATFTVVFTDGTTQTFTSVAIPDWYNAGGATNGIGRVNLTTDVLEGTSSNPHLFEKKLALSTANYSKLIDHILVENTNSGSSTGLIGVFAVSIENVCSGTPSAIATGPATVCPNTSFTLTSSGPDVVGLSYQWQTSLTPAGPYTAISGATNKNYTSPGINRPTYFNVVVTCSVSDSSATSYRVYVYTPYISSFSSTNTTTCTSNDGTITILGVLNSTPYTVTYLKNGVPVSTTLTSGVVGAKLVLTNLTPGIYDNIQIHYSGCASNSVGPVVISTPTQPATPVVSNNTPICHDGTINFTGNDATPAVTWTWSGPNGFTDSVPSPTIASAPVTDAGTYYAYVTDTNGCQSAIATTDVSFLPTPANPTGSSNSPVCAGATLNLKAKTTTSGATYQWTGPAFPTGDTAQNPTINNVTAADAGNYVVYSVLNGCTSMKPLTLNVYVKWLPGVPTVTNNSPICSDKGYQGNNILTFTASDTTGGVTYTWSGPNSFSASSSSKTQTITNPPMKDTGYYYVYATYKGCSSAPDSTHVTLKPTPPPPTLLPSSLTQYCQYDTTSMLIANGIGTISWYTVPSGGAALSSAPTPDATVPALNVWYVTQTVNGCESQYAKDSSLVKAKPLAPNTAGSPYTYCQGDNAKPLLAIGVKLLWYNVPTGGTGSPVNPTPSTNAAGTFDYYVSQTVNGCESDRSHVVVTVKPKPGKPTVNAVKYCQNDIAVPLSAGGVNLLWYNVASGGVGIPTAPTPVTSYPDSAYYYVTQTMNGCESDRAEVPVYTYYKPNAVIVASQPYVCQHDTMSFTYYGNGTADAAYNWTMPKGASIVGGIGQGPIVARFDSAGHYKVVLQVDNHGCKSPLTSYVVDIRQSPIVPVVLQKEACQGDIVNVSIGNPNEKIDNYNWDFGGATVVYGASGAGPYGVRFNNQGLYVVKLVATTSACPSVPILDSIYIHPQADAHIMSVSNSTVCSGDSVHFTAESYNPAYLYQWLPATYFENNTNMGDVYGFIGTSGFVKLAVTTEYGCTSTDSILIHAEPCCDVYFPNAFTPNGDGKNDIFRPLSNGRQQVKNFRVANRWGQIMFETVDQHAGWDGKFAGVPQDMGSYFYYIQYVCSNGKTYEKKGEVVLVR